MKMFRRIFIGAIVCLVAVTFAGDIINEFNDYVRITEMDYRAVVVDEADKDASVVITEQITFDVHAASEDNPMWELWRDLPESYVDGVKVDYNVISVKQILDDGTEVVYEESPKLYWWDEDYVGYNGKYGPGKWYHSKGPYDGEYNFECLLFYVDGLYRETVTFEIEYEMVNASLRYGDSSELYLSLYSGETIKYLNSFKGQILFPLDIMPSSGNYSAYTYGTNSHEFPFEESDTQNPGYHTFLFELDASQLKFKAYNEYIEFALISYGEDKHIFTEYADIGTYYYDNMLADIEKAQHDYEEIPEKAYNNKQSLLVGSIIGTAGVLVLAVLINRRVKRKYQIYRPAMEIDYFRDIPESLDANFARKLVFSKNRKKDDLGDGYAAAMLSLIYKGYVEIEQIVPTKGWDSGNIKIVVKKDATPELGGQPRPALTPVEELYYGLIVRHSGGNEITHSAFQKKVSSDYQYTNSMVSKVKSAITKMGVTSGYFQKANYTAPRKAMIGWSVIYVIIGLLVLIVGNLAIYQTRLDLAFGSFFILGFGFILGAVYLLLVSRGYILLTQQGQDEYEKWHGLYKFLNSETLMKERGVLELAIWEQYLIYATAFGISEKVIKALKIRCPESVMNSSPILRNPYLRTRTFYRTTSRSFGSSARSASFTARSGGHGGFGGGGRGGGGGGGGH